MSLFDGISCGQLALERSGIKIDTYFSSEIDKYANLVTKHNYPNTIQLGDVQKINNIDNIDLLIGGSPCQGFSSAGKGLNFNDPRSILFFEYVRLLEKTKPKYFLLENVNMKKEWQDVITSYIGVEPMFINSRLVSAQDRKRLYWTNIPNVTQPHDKDISFQDIAGDNWFCGSMRGRRINPLTNTRDDYNKDIKIKQYIECRKDNKTNCLTTVCKDNVAVRKRLPRQSVSNIEYRWLTPEEYEQLQTVPVGYTSIVSDSRRRTLLGNGWTVDVIVHIFKNIT